MPLLRAVPIALVLLLAGPAWGQDGNFGALYIEACWEPNDHVAARTRELVRRHSYCRRDSDCVLLDTQASCGIPCGAFVNRRSVGRLARQVRQLDRRHCEAAECAGPLLRCWGARASCVNNRCVPRRLEPRLPPRGTPAAPIQVDPHTGYIPPQRPVEGPTGRPGVDRRTGAGGHGALYIEPFHPDLEPLVPDARSPRGIP